MKSTPSRTRALFAKRNGSSHKSTTHVWDERYGLYQEAYFRDMLSLERKRTERSKNRFVLMLLNIAEVSQNGRRDETQEKIIRRLFTATRETDIKGWFREDSVVGIIFTELNGIEKEFLREKIVGELSTVLSSEEVGKISIRLCVFPEEYDGQSPEGSLDVNLYPDVKEPHASSRCFFFFKRLVDILGSIAALIVFAPVLAAIAVLIKATSEGPVFFRQRRVGQLGKPFTFLKFRTMYTNNDASIHREYMKKFICEQKELSRKGNGGDKRVYKMEKDPRVTPIGTFLRKSSLDEFPQFINVLKGEMSLVGPRPPIPYEVETYDIWHRRRVLEVKPGITGLWQVTGRSSTSFDEMVRLDLKYRREQSPLLDTKIVILTPWVVVKGKGAY